MLSLLTVTGPLSEGRAGLYELGCRERGSEESGLEPGERGEGEQAFQAPVVVADADIRLSSELRGSCKPPGRWGSLAKALKDEVEKRESSFQRQNRELSPSGWAWSEHAQFEIPWPHPCG